MTHGHTVNSKAEEIPSGSVVNNLPAMQETQETRVQSLGQEDPLEKDMATHSSTLAWKIPWTEEHGRLQSTGLQSQIRLSDFTSLHLSLLKIKSFSFK